MFIIICCQSHKGFLLTQYATTMLSALVLRCIQIGLLCVQENAINRPSMLEVVFMLGNETTLPPPKKPAFLFNENQDLPESSTSGGGSSINEVTATSISAR